MDFRRINSQLIILQRELDHIKYPNVLVSKKDEILDLIYLIEESTEILGEIRFFIFAAFLTKVINDKDYTVLVLNKKNQEVLSLYLHSLRNNLEITNKKMRFPEIINEMKRRYMDGEMSMQEIGVVIKDIRPEEEHLIDISKEDFDSFLNKKINIDFFKSNGFKNIIVNIVMIIVISYMFDFREAISFLTINEIVFIVNPLTAMAYPHIDFLENIYLWGVFWILFYLYWGTIGSIIKKLFSSKT